MKNYVLLPFFTLLLSALILTSCYHPEEMHDVDDDSKLTCDYADEGGECGYD